MCCHEIIKEMCIKCREYCKNNIDISDNNQGEILGYIRYTIESIPVTYQNNKKIKIKIVFIDDIQTTKQARGRNLKIGSQLIQHVCNIEQQPTEIHLVVRSAQQQEYAQILYNLLEFSEIPEARHMAIPKANLDTDESYLYQETNKLINIIAPTIQYPYTITTYLNKTYVPTHVMEQIKLLYYNMHIKDKDGDQIEWKEIKQQQYAIIFDKTTINNNNNNNQIDITDEVTVTTSNVGDESNPTSQTNTTISQVTNNIMNPMIIDESIQSSVQESETNDMSNCNTTSIENIIRITDDHNYQYSDDNIFRMLTGTWNELVSKFNIGIGPHVGNQMNKNITLVWKWYTHKWIQWVIIAESAVLKKLQLSEYGLYTWRTIRGAGDKNKADTIGYYSGNKITKDININDTHEIREVMSTLNTQQYDMLIWIEKGKYTYIIDGQHMGPPYLQCANDRRNKNNNCKMLPNGRMIPRDKKKIISISQTINDTWDDLAKSELTWSYKQSYWKTHQHKLTISALNNISSPQTKSRTIRKQ